MSSKVKLPPTPQLVKDEFTPFDVNSLRQTSATDADRLASAADRAYYGTADADYEKRNPGILDANRQMGSQIAAEATGGLPPIIQNALTSAGLGSALGTFGDVSSGSSGLYGIGRNLGVGALQYADSRRNALTQFQQANPERSFGLNGADQLGIALGNQGAQNQVLLGNNQGLNQASAANAQMANQLNSSVYNAQAQAAIKNASSGGLGGILGTIGGAALGFTPFGAALGGPAATARLGGSLGGIFH